MTVTRCPWCGALLDVEWSRWHAPHCPSRKPQPDDDPGTEPAGKARNPSATPVRTTRDALAGTAHLAGGVVKHLRARVRTPQTAVDAPTTTKTGDPA